MRPFNIIGMSKYTNLWKFFIKINNKFGIKEHNIPSIAQPPPPPPKTVTLIPTTKTAAAVTLIPTTKTAAAVTLTPTNQHHATATHRQSPPQPEGWIAWAKKKTNIFGLW